MAKGFCDSMTDDVFAEKLEGVQFESTIVAFSNENLSSSYSVSLYKYGKIVQMISTLYSSVDIERGTLLATIPQGYRPITTIPISVCGGSWSTKDTLSVVVDTYGNFSTNSTGGNLVASKYYGAVAMWLTNE